MQTDVDVPEVTGNRPAGFMQIESGRGSLIVLTPPAKARRIRLKTVREIRDEMARAYRQVRNGEIPIEAGSKLAYHLRQLADVTAIADFEGRLLALEDRRGTTE